MLKNNNNIDKEFSSIDIDGFTFVRIPVYWYKAAHDKRRVINWFVFSWRCMFLTQVIQDKPNIIIASSPSPVVFFGARYLASKFHAKLVFEVRDIWPLTLIELGGYSVHHPFIIMLRWIEKLAYKRSDLIISNLPYFYKHMVKFGEDINKFSWIPNGIDVSEMQTAELLPKNILNKIPQNKFIVGYIGTFGAVNALDSLIDAASLLNDDSISFVLVGHGKERSKLLERVKNMNVKNVTIMESINKKQVQSMLHNFDVCYLGMAKCPLFHYGVAPNKLPEYLFSKKPIIYSIESGDYLPVDDACAGISIPAEDSNSIVDAIIRLRNMSDLKLKELGDNGRAYAIKNHDYKNLSIKLSKFVS